MTLWRLRATVVDKPGFLAVLTASLALRSVNILSVSVHVTEAGAVDDFLVDAPAELTAEQLLAAVERGRGRDAWVARAEARDLVDAPTRALDLARFLVRDPAAVGSALAELLDAEATWLPATAGAAVLGEPDPDDPADRGIGVAGTRMWVPAPRGGTWLVERAAPTFTPAEYARAQALLAVAAAVGGRASLGTPGLGAPAGGTAGPAPAGPAAAALLLPDGRELRIRPAGAADLAAIQAMHGRCSPASLHQRYQCGPEGPDPARLARQLTPARGCTLLVESPGAFADRVVGIGTLVGEGVLAELALLVEDAWQHRGVGTALFRRALAAATDAGFDAVVVHTQAQNTAMQRTLRRLGVTGRADHDGTITTVTVPLGNPIEPCTTGPVG